MKEKKAKHKICLQKNQVGGFVLVYIMTTYKAIVIKILL